jgi:Trypsin-like peptidase domain
MAGVLQQGIARIRAVTDNAVKGAGFVVSRRHVITCAHVVNESLGRRWDSPERPKPDDAVTIDLPYSGSPRAAVLARVAEWFPVAETQFSDIAVLELRSEVAVQPMRLAREATSPGQRFWTIGFPIGQDGGMDAHGTLGVGIEFNRLVAHGDNLPGFFLEGGFSGAPILDTESASVLGMAALAVRERDT